MKIPVGYILVPEEHRGSCRGCAFFRMAKQKCFHPSSIKHQRMPGCGSIRRIFKRDPHKFRTKLAGLINSLGIDNNTDIPDYVLADHMIKSMESLCAASREIKKHCIECKIPQTVI